MHLVSQNECKKKSTYIVVSMCVLLYVYPITIGWMHVTGIISKEETYRLR